MTIERAQTGAYLSEDTATRMRLAMALPCRAYRHLIIHRSLILDDVLKSCEAAGENEVLGESAAAKPPAAETLRSNQAPATATPLPLSAAIDLFVEDLPDGVRR